jgi:hypothetical protein
MKIKTFDSQDFAHDSQLTESLKGKPLVTVDDVLSYIVFAETLATKTANNSYGFGYRDAITALIQDLQSLKEKE